MTNPKLYVYDVGHGVCTLLTGNSYGYNKYCAVFDCGTKAAGKHTISGVLDDMIKKINEAGHIDDIVISHQDHDHHSELLNLIKELNGITDDYFGEKNNYICRIGKKKFHIFRRILTTYKYEDISYENIFLCSRSVTFSTDMTPTSVDIKITPPESQSSLYYISASIEPCQYDGNLKPSKFNCSGNLKKTTKSGEKNEKLDFYDSFWGDMFTKIQNKINEFYHDSFFFEEVQTIIAYFSGFYKNVLNNLSFQSELSRNLIREDIKAPSFPIDRIVLGGSGCGLEYLFLVRFIERFQELKRNGKTDSMSFKGSGILNLSENVFENSTAEENISRLSRDKNILSHTGDANCNDLSILRNSSSVITRFDITPTDSMIFPGDATVHVFDALSKQLTSPQNISFLLAPHHGSDHTNFAYSARNKLKADDDQPLIKLLKSINGCTICVSACNKHDAHPGVCFIGKTENLCKNRVPEHIIGIATGIEDEQSENIELKKTTRAIYTTSCIDKKDKDNNVISYYCFPDDAKPAPTKAMPEKTALRVPSDDCFI